MLKLLYKILGLTFYQQHVGLFLVIGYLMFGMIQGYALIEFHISLLASICSSPINLLLVFVLWTLYTLKAVFFVRQKMALPQYEFAKGVTNFPPRKQQLLWLRMYFLLLLPVVGYACCILFIALKSVELMAFVSTLLVVGILLVGASFYTFRATSFTFTPEKVWIKLPDITFKKPFWTWPLFHLLHQPLVLGVAKAISFLFFNALLLVFAEVGNDIRVFLTAMLAVTLSHALLVLNLIKFESFHLAFAKGLPIHVMKRLLNCGIVFFILLSPEFIMLFVASKYQFQVLIDGVIFSTSSLFFLQMLIYLLKADTDRYFRWLFFFFSAAMFAILAGYYLLFSLILIPVTGIFYLSRYNKIDFKEIA